MIDWTKDYPSDSVALSAEMIELILELAQERRAKLMSSPVLAGADASILVPWREEVELVEELIALVRNSLGDG